MTAMTPQHRYVDSNGQTLHLKEWSHSGTLVILLHHMTANCDDWNSVAPLLADRYHVVAVDLRGRGFSSKPAQGYRWAEDLAEDIVHLIPQLSSGPAVIAGHSLGGMVAIPAAVSGQDRVAAIVLEDPPIQDQKPNYTSEMWRKNLELPKVSCPSLLMYGEHGVLNPAHRQELFSIYEFTQTSQWQGFGHGLHEDADRFAMETKAFLAHCGI